MPTEEELEGQLKIQQDINKVLARRAKMFDAQAGYLEGQVKLAQELCNALDCQKLDGMEDRLAEIRDGLKGASDKAKEGGQSLTDMGTRGAAAGKEISSGMNLAKVAILGAAAGAANGFVGGLKTLGAIAGAAGRVAGSFMNIGKSILSIPFKIMGGLISLSNGLAGAVDPVREAMEDVREQFGSLSEGTGQAVVKGFDSIRKSAGNLGGTGKSVSRIFGPGRAGLAEALKHLGGMMEDLGPLSSHFQGEMEKNAGEMAAWRKGLYTTAEDMQALGHISKTSGKTMTESMREFGNQTFQMASKFNLDRKKLSKDMMAMAGDVEHFGGMGSKELAAMAVYANKLGIEAKSLAGLVDKWDNFESAAEGASKLAQSFGMNIDAMEMMNEQNPAKRMDMLRNSFFESGKAVEDLTRAEKKLLAEQMGLADVADLEKALSDPTVSYDDIMAEAEANEEANLTKEQSMQKLADTIKDVFGSGGKQFKSFGDALMQGFSRGLTKSKGFMKMLRKVRESLKWVYKIGKDIGEAFGNWGPVQQMIGGVTKLLSGDWAGLRANIKDAFQALFGPDGLSKDPKAATDNFLKKIKEAFSAFFGSTSGGGELLDGMKGFATGISLFFLNLLPHAIEGLAKLIDGIVKFIENPSSMADLAPGMEASTQQHFKTAWTNIQKSFKEKLKPALKALWKHMKGPLGEVFNEAKGYIVKFLIMRSLFGAISGALGGAVLSSVGGMLGNALFGKKAAGEVAKRSGGLFARAGGLIKTGFKSLGGKISAAGAKVAAKVGPKIAMLGTKAIPIVGWAIAIGDGLVSVSEQMNKLEGKMQEKYGEMEGTVAAGGAGLLSAITLGLLPDSVYEGFGNLVGAATKGMGDFMDSIGLGAFWDEQMKIWAGAFEFLGGAGDLIMGILTGNGEKVTEGLKKMFSGLWKVVTGIPMQMVLLIKEGIPMILKGLLKLIGEVGLFLVTKLPKAIWAAIKGIGDLIGWAMFKVWEFFTGIFDEIGEKGLGTFLYEKIGGAITAMIDGIWSAIKGAGDWIGEWAADLWLRFKEFWGISSPSSLMMEAGQSLLDGIISILTFLPSKFLQLATWAWEKLTGAFSGVATWAAGFLSDIWNGIKALPDKFLQLATDAWNFVTGIFDKAKDLGASIVSGILEGLGNLKDMMMEKAKAAWDGITGFFGFSSPSKEAASLGGGIVDGMTEGLGDMADKVKQPFIDAWNFVKEVFSATAIGEMIIGVIETLASGFMKVFDIMTTPFRAASEFIFSIIRFVPDYIFEKFQAAWNWISSIFSSETFQKQFMGIVNTILNVAESILNTVLWPWIKAWDWIAGIFGFAKFGEIFAGIKNAVTSALSTMFSILSMPFDDAWAAITSLFSYEKFAEIGTNMIDGIWNMIMYLPRKIKDLIKDALGGVGRLLGIASPSKVFADMGDQMSTGMMNGMMGMKDQMINMFEGVMGHIRGLFDNVLEVFGITGAVERIMGAFDEPRKVLDALTVEYEWLAYGLESLTQQVDDIARLITEDTVDRVLHTVDMISEIVENYNEINDLLANIDPINLDARIDRLGQNMSLSRETITVRNKPINITVNLGLSMDAHQIATQLSKKRNGKSSVALSYRAGTAVTNNIG